jgi:multiple sugar transport system ATP-binding protein
MNMIKGRLDPENPIRFIAADGTALPVANPPDSAKGRDLVYGLRPEYISLDAGGLPGEIVVIEPTGYETHLTLKFGGSDLNCVFRERVNARPGESLNVAIDASHVHLFDAEGGRRLTN